VAWNEFFKMDGNMEKIADFGDSNKNGPFIIRRKADNTYLRIMIESPGYRQSNYTKKIKEATVMDKDGVDRILGKLRIGENHPALEAVEI
jgi:hypothetical protein